MATHGKPRPTFEREFTKNLQPPGMAQRDGPSTLPEVGKGTLGMELQSA